MRNRDCDARRINADWLESQVEEILLAERGNDPWTEEEIIPAYDNSPAMAERAEAIGALATQKAMAEALGRDVSDIDTQIEVHKAELARLAEKPMTPARTIEHDTGETWAQLWRRSSWNERNDYMRRKGIRIEAKKHHDSTIPEVRLITGWRDVGEPGEYMDIANPA
jgi:hypothetical protein